MATEKTVFAEIPFSVTREEYTAATLLVDRRAGVLHALPTVVVGALALLTIGGLAFSWFATPWVPLLFCVTGPVGAAAFLLAQPAAVRRRAARDYDAFLRLVGEGSMALTPDAAVTKTERLTRTDPYALVAECLETAALFVFLLDRERFLVLPKRCLPPETAADVLAFLRRVYARKYRPMHSWVI